MPTDKFEALLKSIRVPIWLEKNTNFYVNCNTGSDTLDDGRGLSVSKPFKTIEPCLQYICDNYNLSKYSATVQIAAGDYVSFDSTITIPKFNATTGTLILNGADRDTTVIGGIELNYAQTISIRNLTLVSKTAASGNSTPILSSSGRIDGYNILIDMTRIDPEVTGGNYFAAMAEYSGFIRFYASNSTTLKPGMFIRCHPTKEVRAFLYAADGGQINFASDLTFVDSPNAQASHSVAYANNLSQIRFTQSIFINPGRKPQINGGENITGRRYVASNNSIIRVGDSVGEFFPGSQAGLVQTGGQYG